jgi:predicted metalloprotease with PDZ domain
MSEYAPFADGAGTFVDETDTSRTFLSYYTYGSGIALALDLALREMSSGQLSLDDYMKLLWTQHGKPGGPVPGVVAKPYGLKDLRDHLASLTNNRKFADDFFDKYVEGREAPDYARLLAQAGYVLQMAASGKGWIGNVRVAETAEGLAIGAASNRGGGATPVPFSTPVYDDGIDMGDVIKTIDGQPATIVAWNAISNKKPGERVSVALVRRGGQAVTKTITVKQDPTAQQVVPVEGQGGSLSASQRAFREAWLGTKVKM